MKPAAGGNDDTEDEAGSGTPVSRDGLRVDRWLWCARFYKSRSMAADAVAGGRVHLNGQRVKPSRMLKPGDRLTVARGPLEFECEVLRIPIRRGPAPEAAECYAESAASVARRAAHAERMRLAPSAAPRPDGRPDKHERRELRRVRGRD